MRRRKAAGEGNVRQASVVQSTETLIPRSDRRSARRIDRRAFRHGIRTALRQSAWRPSLEAQPAGSSTLSGVAAFCRSAEAERRRLDRHRISFKGRPETVGVRVLWRAWRRTAPPPLLAAQVRTSRSLCPIGRRPTSSSGSCHEANCPPRGRAARVTRAAPGSMATPDEARAESRSRCVPSHGVPLRSRGRRRSISLARWPAVADAIAGRRRSPFLSLPDEFPLPARR